MAQCEDVSGCTGPVLRDDLDAPYWQFWRRKRYLVAVLECFGLICMISLRDIMSVAIVAMTTASDTTGVPLSWDTSQQGLVLGSYYYGYISTHVVGALLADRVGGNHVLGAGVALSAVVSLLIPYLARVDVYYVVAARIFQGICHGGCFPSLLMLCAEWNPPLERNRLTSIAYTGTYVGSLVVMMVSGLIAQYTHWSVVFNVFGGLGLLWYVAWLTWVRRRPDLDASMDPRELKYLQQTLFSFEKKSVYPWRGFLTSVPVWAVIMTMICQNWGYFTLLTQMPLYTAEVLDFDIQTAGVSSALPFLVVAISSPVAGQLLDRLLARNIVSNTQARKLICCSAMVLQGLFAALPALFISRATAITSLSLVVGLEGFALSVLFTNYLDISPSYAGILYGLQSTLTTIPGIISPTILGLLVQHKTQSDWQAVFYITSASYITGAAVYGLLGSGELQSWSQESSRANK